MEVPIPTARNQQDDPKVTAAVVSNFLFKAFKSRVDQVLAGKPHTGPLDPELVAELDEIYRRSLAQEKNPQKLLGFYAISRMKEQSHILEPHERLDPYSEWTKTQDPLKNDLAELHNLRDPARLADKVRKLCKDALPGKSAKEVQFFVLHEAIPLGPRVGEAFTVELLQLVPAALVSWPPPNTPETHEVVKRQGELLLRALSQAGNYDRRDIVKNLVDEFSNLIHGKKDDGRYKLIQCRWRQSLRVMKKLRMQRRDGSVLLKLQSEILRGIDTGAKEKTLGKVRCLVRGLQTSLSNLAGVGSRSDSRHVPSHSSRQPVLSYSALRA